MFLSSADSVFFKSRAECFSNSKLHALDRYWSINNSHPMHQQMHEIIENILNTRGEKTIKQSRLDLVSSSGNLFFFLVKDNCISNILLNKIFSN